MRSNRGTGSRNAERKRNGRKGGDRSAGKMRDGGKTANRIRRKEGERYAAQHILNISLPIDYLLPVAKHHACFTVIYIHHDCRNLRVALQKRLYKIVFGRQDWRSQYQNHHNLPRGRCHPYHHVAQQSVFRILVVNLYFKGRNQFPDGSDDFIRLFVFQHTFLHRNNVMGSFLIHSRQRLSVPPMGKRGIHLIPVMFRLLHANHAFQLHIRL